ncbi:unnamed protein product [Ectocarpus sp. CCAP 1310/34]|nr:unnamed protein product [Ectocarpus sp. CCAP 1310/34]
MFKGFLQNGQWLPRLVRRAGKLCTAKKRQQHGSFAGASHVTVRVAATGAR